MSPDVIISSPPAGTPHGTDESGNSCLLLGGRCRVKHFCPEYPEGTVTEMAP